MAWPKRKKQHTKNKNEILFFNKNTILNNISVLLDENPAIIRELPFENC